jgi:uncharacterized protein YegP (UPF0339 family)
MNIEHHTNSPSWADRYEIETYRGKDGDHSFRVKSRQNHKIVVSGEGYVNHADMESTLFGLFPEAIVPGENAVDVPTFTLEDFDPADEAPPGDPEKDCTGAPDAS